MNDTVADSVGKDRVAYLFTPAGHVELGTEDSGSSFVPRLGDLEQIPCLRFLQRIEQPFIKNQQSWLFVLLDHLSVCSVAPRDSKVCKQIGQTNVTDAKESPHSSYPESAGELLAKTEEFAKIRYNTYKKLSE